MKIAETASVGVSIYTGAAGFFLMIVLILLIVSAAWMMVRGGGFEALLTWSLGTLATNDRNAELPMVLTTALTGAMILINTAAEIAIAPYIETIGERFNINGYRRGQHPRRKHRCTRVYMSVVGWSSGRLPIDNLPGRPELRSTVPKWG